MVPTNPAEDRYPPYRAAFDAQRTVAYVFDPERSREDAGWMPGRIEAGETGYAARPEVVRAGRFTVLVLTRTEAAR